MTRADIVSALMDQDNTKVSTKPISNVWKKWKQFGTIADLPRSGASPILNWRHMNYIDEKMEQDREMSSAELSRIFFEDFGINVSAVTVRKIRYKLQWRQSGTQPA